ncbi:hypothetical protein [Arthrobacter methylotrophus]
MKLRKPRAILGVVSMTPLIAYAEVWVMLTTRMPALPRAGCFVVLSA